MRFLDDGRIELDNSTVERAIRPLVLSRKGSVAKLHFARFQKRKPLAVPVSYKFRSIIKHRLRNRTMVGVHDVLLRQAVERGTEELLAQRLATLMDAVAAAPKAARDGVAHALSRPDLTVHWRQDASPTPEHPAGEEWTSVTTRIRALSGFASEVRVRPGRHDATLDRIVGIGTMARLNDGSWLDVEIASFNVLSAGQSMQHSYAAAIGLALLVVVGFAARSVSAPVSALAKAVSRIDLEHELPTLPASGPREVRQLAEALNDMAARTRDAFRQRTLALGALSHDLMSPIARLRLRAEELPEDAREPIRRDLTEMETMVSDVLAYLRGGHAGEPVQPLAVAALVRTVADEITDPGTPIEEGRMDEKAVVPGRRVAGIPPADLPRVTEPFFRGDRARTAGGGSGLGLSTARAIAEAHGGSLVIESTPGRGTEVTLRLPRKATAGAGNAAGNKMM